MAPSGGFFHYFSSRFLTPVSGGQKHPPPHDCETHLLWSEVLFKASATCKTGGLSDLNPTVHSYQCDFTVTASVQISLKKMGLRIHLTLFSPAWPDDFQFPSLPLWASCPSGSHRLN